MVLSILALLDNGVMWIIAAALRTALIAIWVALKASWQRGTVREELEIWIDKVHLRRIDPDGSCQVWQANPYWVDVEMQQTGGPVPNYLTLRGRGRTVEIGSLLSEQARPELAQDLQKTFLSAVNEADTLASQTACQRLNSIALSQHHQLFRNPAGRCIWI